MITSTANSQIKNVMNLIKKASARKEQGLFVVEGERIVKEVPTDRIAKIYLSESYERTHRKDLSAWEKEAAGRPASEDRSLQEDRSSVTEEISTEIRTSQSDIAKRCEVIDDKVFQFMADTKNPQGILALVKIRKGTLPREVQNPVYLILERIQDPGNLGTILRTAEGAGITAVILSPDTADIYNPKVVRSTMGSLFRMPFLYTEDLHATILDLQQSGVKICAAHLAGDHDFYEEDYTGPTAFLIGNEGNGLTPETAALADCKVRIPMEGRLESLNAAVSAALFSYEALRQRRQG